jgi:hypothetical protein
MRPALRERGTLPESAAATTRVVAAFVRWGFVALAGCSSSEQQGLPRAGLGGAPAAATAAGMGTTGGSAGFSAGGVSDAPAGGAGRAGSAGAPAGTGGAGFTSLIPARVRRLASAEYDASVQALLETTQAPASGPDFPPDLRQDGFTVNDAQRVDALIIERLADAADALATEAQANGTLARLAPCDAAVDATTCAKAFITTFGAKVYRRPLLDAEVTDLLALYAAGADGATYVDGVAHVTRGLLQSAGFLYLTELGDGPPTLDGPMDLTPRELAATLSYFLTSAPPDDELVQRALDGSLAQPEGRETQARRLLQTVPSAQDTLVRLVREWLGIDRVAESDKDSLVYPDFAAAKPQIVAESSDFVRAVAFESTGTLSELFGANWTVNSGPLALYQTAGSGPVASSTLVTDRVGILNQAAFLATYANAHESHPVFRGVAVARRVVCLALDSPASFNIQVVPPAPDPAKTTRERFDVHQRDAICRGCHYMIDPFGFSFEHYDGMGAYRDTDNGQPVDSWVVVTDGGDYDGPYADSNELAKSLARSPAVRECFARNLFRAEAATGDGAATAGEDAFMNYWHSLPADAQASIVETLVAVVKNPTFGVRQSLARHD